MTLIENTLFGKVNKVEIAIARLKEFEPEEGYYLAFSGGKDSQVIYELAQMSGVKFDAHYNLTTIDPPELVYFIRNNYKNVIIDKPKKNFWQLILDNRLPPLAGKMPYCCKELKHCYGNNRTKILGVRKEESVSRKINRRLIELCQNNYGATLNPIIDWKEHEVWDFININKLEYCCLYNQGYERLGCIMCCKKSIDKRLQDVRNYPRYYNLFLKIFEKLIKLRKKRHLSCTWQTPEELMNWWIYRENKPYPDPDQTVMFEEKA